LVGGNTAKDDDSEVTTPFRLKEIIIMAITTNERETEMERRNKSMVMGRTKRESSR